MEIIEDNFKIICSFWIVSQSISCGTFPSQMSAVGAVYFLLFPKVDGPPTPCDHVCVYEVPFWCYK